MIIIKILLVSLFTIVISVSCLRIRNSRVVKHHSNPNDHDISTDHKLFLGVEESDTFDKLSPDESKIRLKKLVESKVDKNKDGLVSEIELKEWIDHIFKITKENERDEYFSMFSENSKEPLDFDAYLIKAYSEIDENQNEESTKMLNAKKMLDEQKWKLADENGDNKLDKNEFLAFHHPEIYPKMKPVLIQEMLELSDENKDGFLDIKEYINDIWPSTLEERPNEDMIKEEKKIFLNHRDKNKDKKLDKEEIGEWLMPSDYNPVDAEAKHLMQYSDINKDGYLSMEEIINSSDIFVGSQVTDYSNLLKHEEL